MGTTTKAIVLASVCVVAGIVIGVLIGWFSRAPNAASNAPPTADPTISRKLNDEVSAEKIYEYLEYFSKEPHIAGRDVDEVKLVNYIKSKWEEFGIHVEVHPYEVLLSYPNQTDSNIISISLKNGTEIFHSQPSEMILDDTQISDKVVNPFNAYSATGDVEGQLVYVNYARVEDFIRLTRELKVDPTGHVCISRYGMIFRGSKAMIAQDYGCTGLILYSDPVDYTVPWDGVYPDSWYLPGTGAQRGNLHIVKGDPLTPQYPALDTAWRMWENETRLPAIPVTPIGYDDAIKYLRPMGGNEVPKDWQGGLNISYRLGPGFSETFEGKTGKIKMHVTTKNQMATIHNIFGYIKGEVEPDRYVLVGNHRDAWVFGAMDPSIGTASLMEISRVIGHAVKNGWKPRRTIVFCSWGAEEYGLLGSTEWVEEFQKILSFRSVAYLNVDTAVSGNYTLAVGASPNLKEVIYESAKLVKTPHEDEIAAGRTTLYQTWAKRSPETPHDPNSLPRVPTLGSGSDFTAFLQVAGISSSSTSYLHDWSIGIRFYPVYHTVYETFDLVKKFVDPGFKICKAVTQLMAEVARRLMDEPVLPLNCRDYAAKLLKDKQKFVRVHGNNMKAHNIDLDQLDYAVANFSEAADELHARIEELDITKALDLRAINDQLMLLDRAFIDMNGIGERTNFRHVVYAPSLHNTYASSAFPGLVDSLFDIDQDPDQAAGRWREVERQYSILLFHIGSAASTMRDVFPIKGHSNL